MKNRSKLNSTAVLFVFLILCTILVSGCTRAQTDMAYSKIQAANSAIEQAFNTLYEAEKNGADVTDLMDQLNLAANNIAKATNAYRTEDYILAATLADAAVPIAQQVTASAENLQNAASNVSWLTTIFTIIAAIILILVLFLVWRWFKSRYITRLSQAKPEVKTN